MERENSFLPSVITSRCSALCGEIVWKVFDMHPDSVIIVTRSSPRTSAQRTGHIRSLVVSQSQRLCLSVRAKLDFDRLRPNASTREICAPKCSTFSLTYGLHQQLQTYILFQKYRQLIRSTLRTGTVPGQGLNELSQTTGYTTRKQSTDSQVNSYIL